MAVLLARSTVVAMLTFGVVLMVVTGGVLAANVGSGNAAGATVMGACLVAQAGTVAWEVFLLIKVVRQ